MSNVIQFPGLYVAEPTPVVVSEQPSYVDEFEDKHLDNLTYAVHAVTEAKTDEHLRALLRDIKAQTARWDID